MSDRDEVGRVVVAVTGAVLLTLMGALFSGLFSLLPSLSANPITVVALALALCFGVWIIYSSHARGTANSADLAKVSTRLADIEAKLGTPADLVFEGFGESTGDYYRRLGNLVNATKAGDTIRVMTYHSRLQEPRAKQPTEAHAKARDAYHRVLLKKADEGINYHRILCYENTTSTEVLPKNLLRHHTLQHCVAMLDIFDRRPQTLSVRKAPAVVMLDIFLLNDNFGAISIETYAEQAHNYTAGALFVSAPPNGNILEKLRSWWDEANNKSAAISRAELSDANPASTPGSTETNSSTDAA